MKSVATAVCSQARKSDSARNSNCTAVCPVWQKHEDALFFSSSAPSGVTSTASVSCDTVGVWNWPLLLPWTTVQEFCARREIWYKQFECLYTFIHPFRGWRGGDKTLSVNYQLIHYVHLINACFKSLASFNSHMSVIFSCNPTAVESWKCTKSIYHVIWLFLAVWTSKKHGIWCLNLHTSGLKWD